MRIGEIWIVRKEREGSCVSPVKITRIENDEIRFVEVRDGELVCANEKGYYRTDREDFFSRYYKDYSESR